MPSARQLSITADQIDCKIAEARGRIRSELDRFMGPMTADDVEDAIGNIGKALHDQRCWEQVGDAYERIVV